MDNIQAAFNVVLQVNKHWMSLSMWRPTLKLHSVLLGVRSARRSCDRRAKTCDCRRQRAVLKDQPLMQDLWFIPPCLRWNACAARFFAWPPWLKKYIWNVFDAVYFLLLLLGSSLCMSSDDSVSPDCVLGVLLFSAALQGAKSTQDTMTVHPHSSTFLFATFHLMVAYSHFCCFFVFF